MKRYFLAILFAVLFFGAPARAWADSQPETTESPLSCAIPADEAFPREIESMPIETEGESLFIATSSATLPDGTIWKETWSMTNFASIQWSAIPFVWVAPWGGVSVVFPDSSSTQAKSIEPTRRAEGSNETVAPHSPQPKRAKHAPHAIRHIIAQTGIPVLPSVTQPSDHRHIAPKLAWHRAADAKKVMVSEPKKVIASIPTPFPFAPHRVSAVLTTRVTTESDPFADYKRAILTEKQSRQKETIVCMILLLIGVLFFASFIAYLSLPLTAPRFYRDRVIPYLAQFSPPPKVRTSPRPGHPPRPTPSAPTIDMS